MLRIAADESLCKDAPGYYSEACLTSDRGPHPKAIEINGVWKDPNKSVSSCLVVHSCLVFHDRWAVGLFSMLF